MILCKNCRRLIRNDEHAIEIYYCLGPMHTDQGLIEGYNVRQNTAGQIIMVQDGYESHISEKTNIAYFRDMRARLLKVAERMGYHESIDCGR